MHIGKTGGQSINNWWGDEMKVFEYSLEMSKKSSDQVYNLLLASDIIHIHGATSLKEKLDTKLWTELLDQSIRFSVIRNPISKLESDWRYAYQTSSNLQLPYVPNFVKEKIISPNDSIDRTRGGYFDQNLENQISINDFIDIYFEFHQRKLPHYKRTENEATKSFNGTSPYFNFACDDANDGNTELHFRQDAQINDIGWHLGGDFISSPRSKDKDILITTELLNESFALLILSNPVFRRFTKFSQEDLAFENTISSLQELSLNSSEEKYKKDPNFLLSPSNRYRFYLYNRLDFTCWQSATIQTAQQIKEFKNEIKNEVYIRF